MHMNGLTRRSFLAAAAAGGAAFLAPNYVADAVTDPPANRLNVAAIGVGGKGKGAVKNIARSENLVVMCDVDEKRAAPSFDQFPDVRRFKDYRRMFDRIGDQIDAVVISTPDHSHFHAAMWAIQRGKHVYVEKPLAHTIWEVRQLGLAAAQHGVITQMGNQGHSTHYTALMRDWMLADAIGDVREVVLWKNSSKFTTHRPQAETPPPTLQWDLWLNRTPQRAYWSGYAPYKWRYWHYYGEGMAADWGCHTMDPPNYALDLGAPDVVKAEVTGPWPVEDSYPTDYVISWHFPARGDMPAVRVRYFIFEHGTVQEVVPRPEHLEPDRPFDQGAGGYMVGERGTIMHGSHSHGARIVPESRMQEVGRVPERSPRVRGGHMGHFFKACKGEAEHRPLSHFDYAAPYTESILLGELALRSRHREVHWDPERMRVTNDDSVNPLVGGPEAREGWEI